MNEFESQLNFATSHMTTEEAEAFKAIKRRQRDEANQALDDAILYIARAAHRYGGYVSAPAVSRGYDAEDEREAKTYQQERNRRNT